MPIPEGGSSPTWEQHKCSSQVQNAPLLCSLQWQGGSEAAGGLGLLPAGSDRWIWNSQDCNTFGTFPRDSGWEGGLEPVQGAELPWGSFWGSSEPVGNWSQALGAEFMS